MNEEEKEEIELNIEAKYVDKTEKEFLSKVTYAECLYILTPKNKYCDKIKELSMLKLCEIIEKLHKENETLKNKLSLKQFDINVVYNDYLEKLNEYKRNSIPVQKIKDKIEEIQEEGYWLLTTDRDSDKCVEFLQELLDEREGE